MSLIFTIVLLIISMLVVFELKEHIILQNASNIAEARTTLVICSLRLLHNNISLSDTAESGILFHCSFKYICFYWLHNTLVSATLFHILYQIIFDVIFFMEFFFDLTVLKSFTSIFLFELRIWDFTASRFIIIE